MELVQLDKGTINKYAPDFWHTSQWIDYCIDARFEKGEDCTVGVEKNGELIAIMPLIREGEEFTFQRSFGPQILCEHIDLGKISELLIHHAYNCDVRRIAIEGFMPQFITHAKQICVADIENPRIRKSYKSLTKSRLLACRESQDVDKVRDLYFKIAGKVTRPPETFEHIKEWIAKGYATILCAYFQDKLIGFTLVTHYTGEAYYFMCGVLEEYKRYNVSHFLQGRVLELLKGKGVVNYVLGNIDSNTLLGCPTTKDESISFFKAGWGNPFRYKVVSEYFLDKEYFKLTQEKRIKEYMEAEYE